MKQLEGKVAIVTGASKGIAASAGSPEDAAKFGEIVFVAIPFYSYQEVPVEPLKGKIVVDCGNYFFERDGHVPEIDSGKLTSSDVLAKHLSGSKVVRAFSSVISIDLVTAGSPEGTPKRRALPIAGDDQAAKKVVASFISSLGFDTVDVGPLTDGRLFERDTPLFAAPFDKESLKAALQKSMAGSKK
jgi:predicted dinucleotide-binding enzyme